MTELLKIGYDEYQAFTDTTAVYPSENTEKYLYLGLIGEAGEVANKVKKFYRGDYDASKLSKTVIEELGDCLWYVAQLCTHYRLRLSEIAFQDSVLDQDKNASLDDYVYLLIALGTKAGTVSINTNDLFYTSVRQTLGMVIEAISNITEILIGGTLEEVIRANRAKLTQRKNEGTLQGDGDNR